MSSNQSNGPNPVEAYTQGTGTSSSDPFITIIQTRDPTPYDFQFPVKKRWINLPAKSEWILTSFSNVTGQSLAVWTLLNAGQNLISLSDNTTPITPASTVDPSSSGNIQLTGEVRNTLGVNAFSTVVADPANHSIAINPMSSARWIVDPLGINGTHTTIQGALNSAFSGETILVLPGTYTEDIQLPSFAVNLVGQLGDDLTPIVTISGSFTTFRGGSSVFGTAYCIGNINLMGNSLSMFPAMINVNTGTVLSPHPNIINFNNCSISVNTGVITSIINYNDTLSSSRLIFNDCLLAVGDITTCNFFTMTGTGAIIFNNCQCVSGNPNPAIPDIISSGSLLGNYSSFQNPIIASGASNTVLEYCTFSTLSNAVDPAFTTTSSGAQIFKFCDFTSGSFAAVSIGAPSTVQMIDCNIFSTATNVLTGAGILLYGGLNYLNNSKINVTTQTPFPTGPRIKLSPFSGSLTADLIAGTGSPNTVVTAPLGSLFTNTASSTQADGLFLNTNAATAWANVPTTKTVSFVPAIQFGGASHLITYDGLTQGYYTIIGNIVYVYGFIALTNKGDSTGNATFSTTPALPTSNSTFRANFQIVIDQGITLDAGYTSIFGLLNANASSVKLLEQGSGSTATFTTDTNYTNTSQFEFTGWYSLT